MPSPCFSPCPDFSKGKGTEAGIPLALFSKTQHELETAAHDIMASELVADPHAFSTAFILHSILSVSATNPSTSFFFFFFTVV